MEFSNLSLTDTLLDSVTELPFPFEVLGAQIDIHLTSSGTGQTRQRQVKHH